MNLENTHKIYFIGIGGIGMSAVAGLAKAKGFEVSGSDSEEIYDPAKAVLDNAGISYKVGYAAENIGHPDLIVAMAGLDQNNPEIKAAEQKNISVVSYAELLGALVKDKKRIVVVGTHGKGTTAGMLSFVLKNLEDAGFFVGGVLTDLGTNFYFGTGPYFVIEGDEYKAGFDNRKPKFSYYDPDLLLINNIEFDHPDLYADLQAFKQPFIELVSSMRPGTTVIYNQDDQNVKEVINSALNQGQKFVAFSMHDQSLADASLESYKLPGIYHNDYAAAISALKSLGYQLSRGAEPDKLLQSYSGIKRRFEIIRDDDLTVIDDYAHHATAVRLTLEAAKEKYPGRRIVAIFEPHTYSRTKETLSLLENAFAAADLAYIAEIYPAREQKLPSSISGEEVVLAVSKHHQNVHYVRDKEDALRQYAEQTQKGDVVVVMAVGSFNKLAYDISERKTKWQ